MKGSSPRRARRIDAVARSLWFVPALMATAGVLLGVAMPLVDAVPAVLAAVESGWPHTVLDSTPSGAQQLLATSAGALATVLGVAFSLTLVTLQLAAAQYTPRLVGRLLEDAVTKFVLGSYLGTIAYLLLVLRSIHGVGDDRATFVPRTSLLVALVLILGCLGLFAFFVHHLGTSIQPASVGSRVVAKTIHRIRRLDRDDRATVLAARPEAPPGALQALSDSYGYVQLVDLDRLVSALPPPVACVRVDAAAGDFVLPGTPLVTVWPPPRPSPGHARALLQAFALGPQRTDDQDVLYGVRQLADVGLKALSPGVNDETTAVAIVNQLGAVLEAACARGPDAGGWRRHEVRGVAVFAPALGARRIVEDGFAGLVRFSGDHPRVLARIVEVLGAVAALQPDGDARNAMLEVADWVEHAASRSDLGAHEQRLVAGRLAQLRAPRPRAPADRPHALH